MSIASHDSSADFGLEPYVIHEGPPEAGDDQATVWLDGDVLACACPDCGAPMSIRLWLMLADCFRCGATIELTEEQEQEALRLLRDREARRRAESAAAAATIQPRMARRTKQPAGDTRKPEPRIHRPAPPVPGGATANLAGAGQPRQPTQARDSGVWSEPSSATLPKPPAGPPPTSARRRVAASQAHRGVRARVRDLYKRGGMAVWLSELLRDLPAWLVSFVFHFVLLLLLSLWIVEPYESPITLTLSTSVSEHDLEGEIGDFNPMVEPLDFEDPGAIEVVHALDDLGASAQVDPELNPVDLPMDLQAALSIVPRAVVL
ncbi:MAG: hypothetical protein U1E05_14675, partial [Patescibacteria group bacterium]|nr:hypothetical protein [Patescibacteria group bacterium]